MYPNYEVLRGIDNSELLLTALEAEIINQDQLAILFNMLRHSKDPKKFIIIKQTIKNSSGISHRTFDRRWADLVSKGIIIKDIHDVADFSLSTNTPISKMRVLIDSTGMRRTVITWRFNTIGLVDRLASLDFIEYTKLHTQISYKVLSQNII